VKVGFLGVLICEASAEHREAHCFMGHLSLELSSKTGAGIGTLGIGPALSKSLAQAGAAVFLASDAARVVAGYLLVVDRGFLVSGVNRWPFL
jgi:hypothetical protein